MSFSEVHTKSSGGEYWDEIIKEINEQKVLRHLDPPEKEKKILDYYFQHHIKPRKIASKLNISSHKVYSVVKSIKNVIKRFEDKRRMKASQSRGFSKVILEMLSDFCRSHSGLAYTVSDVRKHLAQAFPNELIPSESYICRYMKRQLGLSYKRVSWRPPLQRYEKFIVDRETYSGFALQVEKEKFVIVQIDEFTVNRSTYTAMAWGKRGISSFCHQDQPSDRFSVIAAISINGLELLTISKKNTNGDVFCCFILLLIEKLKKRYEIDKQKVIVT